MTHWTACIGGNEMAPASERDDRTRRLVPDGGRTDDEEAVGSVDDSDEEAGESAADSDAAPGDEPTNPADDAEAVETSNVEVTAAGDTEPVDPRWEKPDIEDIPEVDGPKTRPAESSAAEDAAGGEASSRHSATHGDGHAQSDAAAHAGVGDDRDDPTAGMPNTARSPGQSRLKEGGADGFVVALELCARLPDEVRLPEEAADLVPVALEAELEEDVQSFAAEEFDNPAPHVDRLDFVEADGDIWLRLRLGVAPEAFADLDPEAIQHHALQQIDGLL